MRKLALFSLPVFMIACGNSEGDVLATDTGYGTGMESDTGDDDDGDEDDETEDDGGMMKLDVDPGNGGGGECTVGDGGLDGVPECEDSAPSDIFDPEIQWEWWGENGDTQSTVTPLVANLTDDDDNTMINLCDIPDVVILASPEIWPATPGHIYVLDGETGDVHYSIDDVDLDPNINAALGDIDGDGIPEILAVQWETMQVVAFEHDGTLAWTGEHPFGGQLGSLAIADIDQDGTPEIITYDAVLDNEGHLLFETDGDWSWSPTAANLDGEPGLEVLWGGTAMHSDGTVWFSGQSSPGFTAVVDIDDDPEPEIINTSFDGIRVLEHDGTPKWGGKPIDIADVDAYLRPHAIHDFDGNGDPELAMSTQDLFSVFDIKTDGTVEVMWSSQVLDSSGSAGGTGFDFNRDGQAEAMYADETTLFVFNGEDPEPFLEWPRLSRTLFEYPVVADADNDGSAEIVVVSNECIDEDCGLPMSPTVVMIRDKEERWMQPRRIWNQHSYHVTNVREDGTIPAEEVDSWKEFNTFRTNAQFEEDGVCKPKPQG